MAVPDHFTKQRYPTVIGVAETSKLKRERRVVRISRREMYTGSLCGKLKERPDLQDLEADGTIMLK